MKQQPRVLVLDSGIGGLSVTQALRTQCPNTQWVYVADLAAFPYGNHSEDHLSAHIIQLVGQVLTKYPADLAVIACNTASTAVLEPLRATFDLPFVGVVPAIKPAALLSETKVIGVLATEGTVNRAYTQTLIDQFAQGCEVHLFGTRHLVLLAEKKLRGRNLPIQEVRDTLDEFILLDRGKPMDTVVLACTHFPLLKSELRTAYPHILHWVDSGEAIARRVHYWLNQLGAVEAIKPHAAENLFITTGEETRPYPTECIRALLGPFKHVILPPEKTRR